MRSDKWDKKENQPFDGIQRKDPKDHEHSFSNGKCIYCGKTREQLRKEW